MSESELMSKRNIGQKSSIKDQLRNVPKVPEELRTKEEALKAECDVDEDPMKALEEALKRRNRKVCGCMDQAGKDEQRST